MSFSKLVSNWRDENRANCLEGERGIVALNKLANELGYKEDLFKYGSSLENFLKDNPGACEAIFEWISTAGFCNAWESALSDYATCDDCFEKVDECCCDQDPEV